VRKCVAEMKQILDSSPVNLAGPDGAGLPKTEDHLVVFTFPTANKAVDAFVFPGHAGVRNECKTQGQAHDPVVTACLLVMMDHFTKDEVEIGSDGKVSAGSWDMGIALYKKVLHREPNLSKGTGLGDFIDHINLKPNWGPERLLIVAGLALLGLLAYRFAFNPRPDFVMLAGGGRDPYLSGRFPAIYADRVREFFRKDVTGPVNFTIKGWTEPSGRFRLQFTGDISDKDQQRVRNFFGLLRKKAESDPITDTSLPAPVPQEQA
jgi:hypothetical protein